MSERTVERYKKLVVEDDRAARIMNDTTMALAMAACGSGKRERSFRVTELVTRWRVSQWMIDAAVAVEDRSEVVEFAPDVQVAAYVGSLGYIATPSVHQSAL